MAHMDANAAFDAVQKIAKSSRDAANLQSMKPQARAVIDQFRAALSTMHQSVAKCEERVLLQYLDGACKTKRVDAIETPVFMEARDHLKGATPSGSK